MNERINRPDYIKRLIEHRDKDVVKIVTGMRRCGKSTLLDLFVDYLLDDGVPKENIVQMNMESLRFRQYADHISFYEYVSDKITGGGKHYLIFDELQSVEHWEKAI